MDKYFIGAFESTMPPQFHDPDYRDEEWVPESIHRISFCSLERARVFADKLREKCPDIFHTSQASCIYPVSVPDNWSGEDVATWLEGIIAAGTYVETELGKAYLDISDALDYRLHIGDEIEVEDTGGYITDGQIITVLGYEYTLNGMKITHKDIK